MRTYPKINGILAPGPTLQFTDTNVRGTGSLKILKAGRTFLQCTECRLAQSHRRHVAVRAGVCLYLGVYKHLRAATNESLPTENRRVIDRHPSVIETRMHAITVSPGPLKMHDRKWKTKN